MPQNTTQPKWLKSLRFFLAGMRVYLFFNLSCVYFVTKGWTAALPLSVKLCFFSSFFFKCLDVVLVLFPVNVVDRLTEAA